MKTIIGLLASCFCVVTFAAEEIQYKATVSEGNGISATILVWTENDPTGKLLGKRNWYIGDDFLYAAVSVEELAVIKDKLYGKDFFGWPWKSALNDKIVASCWYDRDPCPFYALRLDYFSKFQKEIQAVHKGKLPWQVTRTEKDDPKKEDQK